jgi:hypothetical protein
MPALRAIQILNEEKSQDILKPDERPLPVWKEENFFDNFLAQKRE